MVFVLLDPARVIIAVISPNLGWFKAHESHLHIDDLANHVFSPSRCEEVKVEDRKNTLVCFWLEL